MRPIFLFGDCRLDPARRELVRGGEVQAVEPQVLDLILDLIERRERIVTRNELLERIWQGRFVSEATLSSRIKMARRAIGDNGREQALIRTIHGRGFRFVGTVRLAENGEPAPTPPPEEQPAAAGRVLTPEAERRQLTIARCSLADAGLALGSLDAEEVDDFLERARALLVATFEARGGYVAQLYPAGVLVYFGWPRAQEDAAPLAVQAALEAGPALSRLSAAAPEAVRCGVATGTVVVGGTEMEEGRLAGGQAPLLATRLMDLAAPGTVVIAAATRTLLGGAFVLEEHRSDRLAELGPGSRAWRALGAAPVATRFEAGARARLAPLIGRDEELALLRRRWQRASAGDGQVVLVAGDAGIGKSRLVHEFGAQLEQSEHWRITCQCQPHHETSALHPVIRELERAAGFERGDPEATRSDKIRRLLARAGQWSAEATGLIARLLSGPGAPPEAASAQQRQEMTLALLTEMVAGLARQRPTLFLLEDAHWIDPTTEELMHRIVDLAGVAPVVVLITHRLDYAPPFVGRPHVGQLSLSRLTATDAALMARQLAGAARLSEAVQAQIAARTDGVPLYVEELTRAILGNHRATPPFALAGIPAEIPATLQDLLLSQLDGLGEAGEVAKIGAAIGRSFSRELLLKLADLPAAEFDAALGHLVGSGLVFATGSAGGARYVFKHALVQDAAYQGLTRRRRRSLHARIAAALEARPADGRQTGPEILAQHYEKAERPAEALACWRRAGEIAAGRYAHSEAVAHFGHALRLLRQAPEEDARLRLEADVLRRLGPSMIAALGDGHAAVRETYLRLEEIGRSIDDERLRCDALFGLSQCAQVSEHVDHSLAIAERYLTAAQRVDDGRQLAIAHWIRAQDYWRAGRFADGVAEARRGQAAFDARQPKADLLEDPEVLNRTVELYCACMLGEVERALRDLRAMTTSALEAANPLTPERTLTVLGVTHQLLQQVDETAGVVQQMTALSQTHRRPQHGDWLALLRAWVLTAQGHFDAGLAQARSAMRGLEIKSRRPRRLSILAECFAAAGEVATAQDLVERALAETDARGERFWEAELNRQRGDLLLLADRPVEEASAAFERALAIARWQGARLFELKAAVSLGCLLTRLGRRGETAGLVGPVLAHFDQRLDLPDLRAARKLLDLARSA